MGLSRVIRPIQVLTSCNSTTRMTVLRQTSSFPSKRYHRRRTAARSTLSLALTVPSLRPGKVQGLLPLLFLDQAVPSPASVSAVEVYSATLDGGPSDRNHALTRHEAKGWNRMYV